MNPNDEMIQSGDRDYKGQDLSRPGSGGGGCDPQNEVWTIHVIGSPTGGTFDLDVSVAGAAAQSLTFNYNSTAAQAETEFETHTGIGSGDVSVSDGPLPGTSLTVEFEGTLAETEIGTTAPVVDTGNLTGGDGIGVVVVRWQKGIA